MRTALNSISPFKMFSINEDYLWMCQHDKMKMGWYTALSIVIRYRCIIIGWFFTRYISRCLNGLTSYKDKISTAINQPRRSSNKSSNWSYSNLWILSHVNTIPTIRCKTDSNGQIKHTMVPADACSITIHGKPKKNIAIDKIQSELEELLR